MKGFLFFSFFLYFVDTVFAAEAPDLAQREEPPAGIILQKLFTISSDTDNNKVDLMLMVDKNGLAQGLYKKEVPGYVPAQNENGANVYWTRDMESSSGAVLLNRQNRDVLILQGELDRETQEGNYKLKFLTDGISMTYAACDLLLKNAGGRWFVQNAYTGAAITKAKVTTNWMGTGISSIQGICIP